MPGASVNDAWSLTKVRTLTRSYASTRERGKTWMDSFQQLLMRAAENCPSKFCIAPASMRNSHVPSSHSCDPVRCCRLACLQAIHQNTTSPRPNRASLPSISISTTIYTASLRAASASVTSVRVQPFCARRSVSAGFFGGFQAPHYERSSLRAICRFLRSDKRASGPMMSSLSPSASRTQSSYGWCVE